MNYLMFTVVFNLASQQNHLKRLRKYYCLSSRPPPLYPPLTGPVSVLGMGTFRSFPDDSNVSTWKGIMSLERYNLHI